jgi:prephenate dehydratase
MKVAFQGVHGAYSEVAAKKLLGLSCQTYPLETFERVFESVEKAHVERGIIPIENSLAGSIHQNYDLLLSHRLHIVGETYLRIEHALSCHPASSLRRLKYVRSHPQALAQCSRFFARHKKLTPVAYFDTAGAAKSLVENRTVDTGAIASAYAARLYGLIVLKNNVEDQPNNYTRFLVISRKPWRPRTGKASKSSIAFIPKRNEVGVLFKILGVFSLRGIDLLKIESRPNPRSPFEYLFYLDLLGSSNEKQVARAFDHLQEMVMNFRLLGSYPLGKGRFHAGKE